MREILFRGKQTDNGGWEEGCLIHCDLIDGRSYTCILVSDESKVYPTEFPYLCCESGCIDGYATPVKPETVGQFTGLTDKNGKRIFEGDILSEHGRLFVVAWDQKWAQFRLQHIGRCIQYPEWNRGVQMEIVGNILDNPELLEE